MATDHCGVKPAYAGDLSSALAQVRADGAVIVRGIGTSADEATGLARRIFGNKVLSIPEAARVFEGGEKDRYVQPDHHKPLRPHTDGFAYGDLFPDFIMLTCVNASPKGGESFLVDGYALLDQLAADPETGWVVDALSTVSVDQTEEDMQVSQSPIVQYNERGRKLLRRTFNQAPLPSSEDPARDQAMIDAWIDAVDAAGKDVPRFRLEEGDALVIDNYRVLHAREGYSDPDRMMWRVWIWTDECLGVPGMRLHSDSRFAIRTD